MNQTYQTHDHQQIKEWANSRKAVPAKVKGTGSNTDEGILRIHFPQHSTHNDDLEEIEWDDFFQKFEENNLDLIYQEKTKDGDISTFHKFVKRT
ncbi:MAG TPA: hypothetical protein VEV16_03260 [Daejeonella sp.]|nr:hypothetical protein [Daejeonella sp.]